MRAMKLNDVANVLSVSDSSVNLNRKDWVDYHDRES